MRRHEITVLAETDDGLMALVDRCTLGAKDSGDAAAKHAALYVGHSDGLPHAKFTGPTVMLTASQVATARRALADAADYRSDGGGPDECGDCTEQELCLDHKRDRALAAEYDQLLAVLQEAIR